MCDTGAMATKAASRKSAPRKGTPRQAASRSAPARKSAATQAAAAAGTGRVRAPMSAGHKQALAVGREESRAVRRYLEALQAHKPKRGRKRTSESIQARLDQIERRLATAR